MNNKVVYQCCSILGGIDKGLALNYVHPFSSFYSITKVSYINMRYVDIFLIIVESTYLPKMKYY